MSKKKPTYYKSQFTVMVEDTVFFKKEDGIQDLKNRTSFSGINVKIDHRFDNVFFVETRARNIHNAKLDNRFVKKQLNLMFGKVTSENILGMIEKRRKTDWIFVDPKEFLED